MIRINLIPIEAEIEIETAAYDTRHCNFRCLLNKYFHKSYTLTCPYRLELRHEWEKYKKNQDLTKFQQEYNLTDERNKNENE